MVMVLIKTLTASGAELKKLWFSMYMNVCVSNCFGCVSTAHLSYRLVWNVVCTVLCLITNREGELASRSQVLLYTCTPKCAKEEKQGYRRTR